MPLIIANLQSSITDILTFVGATQTKVPVPTLADKWSTAFDSYMRTISNPASPALFTPAGFDAAKAAMQQSLLGMTAAPVALAAFLAGFTAYVGIVAAVSAPFVSTPPIGPVPLPAALAVPAPIPVSAAAAALAIDTWVRTGTASIPPSPPLPWT